MSDSILLTTPNLRQKNNDPSMRHVTVKQIYDAKEVIPDSPCVLDGRPLGTVRSLLVD
jgi:hypothetical protein